MRTIYLVHQLHHQSLEQLVGAQNTVASLKEKRSDLKFTAPYLGFVIDSKKKGDAVINEDDEYTLLNNAISANLDGIQEVWMIGRDITKGMAKVAENASKRGIIVVDLTRIL